MSWAIRRNCCLTACASCGSAPGMFRIKLYSRRSFSNFFTFASASSAGFWLPEAGFDELRTGGDLGSGEPTRPLPGEILPETVPPPPPPLPLWPLPPPFFLFLRLPPAPAFPTCPPLCLLLGTPLTPILFWTPFPLPRPFKLIAATPFPFPTPTPTFPWIISPFSSNWTPASSLIWLPSPLPSIWLPSSDSCEESPVWGASSFSSAGSQPDPVNLYLQKQMHWLWIFRFQILRFQTCSHW